MRSLIQNPTKTLLFGIVSDLLAEGKAEQFDILAEFLGNQGSRFVSNTAPE